MLLLKVIILLLLEQYLTLRDIIQKPRENILTQKAIIQRLLALIVLTQRE
jgi:hypothetical protein